MTSGGVDARTVGLLAEAAEWRLLGLLFEYPTAAWRAQVAALLPDLRGAGLRGMAEAALETASEGLHIALFGPSGTVPAREATHGGGVQLGYLMAELSAYYEAFGYRPENGEADDHISVEAGFVAYLRVKQAMALANGDEEHALISAEAAASFVKEHLAALAEPVSRALDEFAPEYLAAAGRAILAQAGPSPRSSYPLGDAMGMNGEEEEISCGPSAAGGELIQLEP